MAWWYLGQLLKGHHVHSCGDTFLTPTLSALGQLLKLLVVNMTNVQKTSTVIFTCLASSESDKDFDSVVGEI